MSGGDLRKLKDLERATDAMADNLQLGPLQKALAHCTRGDVLCRLIALYARMKDCGRFKDLFWYHINDLDLGIAMAHAAKRGTLNLFEDNLLTLLDESQLPKITIKDLFFLPETLLPSLIGQMRMKAQLISAVVGGPRFDTTFDILRRKHPDLMNQIGDPKKLDELRVLVVPFGDTSQDAAALVRTLAEYSDMTQSSAGPGGIWTKCSTSKQVAVTYYCLPSSESALNMVVDGLCPSSPQQQIDVVLWVFPASSDQAPKAAKALHSRLTTLVQHVVVVPRAHQHGKNVNNLRSCDDKASWPELAHALPVQVQEDISLDGSTIPLCGLESLFCLLSLVARSVPETRVEAQKFRDLAVARKHESMARQFRVVSFVSLIALVAWQCYELLRGRVFPASTSLMVPLSSNVTAVPPSTFADRTTWLPFAWHRIAFAALGVSGSVLGGFMLRNAARLRALPRSAGLQRAAVLSFMRPPSTYSYPLGLGHHDE
jgi:hypothetical protein